ncbi:MAG: sugar phosphate isomerase/epimerase [Mucilaginibacter sp.]|nr:sugar phosphate isomerase/epimerase [Mucilaginibacter sp.]
MKLKTGIVLLLLSAAALFSFRTQQKPPNALGLILSIDKDSIAHAAGFKMIGESVGKMLSPSLNEEKFRSNIERINKAQCKVYMCNILFPSSMKIAGPAVNTPRVLAYVDSVFLRAEQANIKHIILGSGGSRRLPDGYDTKKAQADFTLLCGKLALVAQKHHIMLVLESLETAETNFLLTLKETAEVVRAVNNPNFKLNADIYHMGRMKETPQVIVDNADIIVHCEIAELEIRTLPGMKGDDLKPYLRALRTANYKGPIFMEPGAPYTAADAAMSFKFLTRQLEEVYAE